MKICAVIVLYQPEAKTLKKLLQQLSSQVDTLCIVDNSPHRLPTNFFEFTCNYQHFPENLGIAEAQNLAIEFASGSEHDFVVLFDQDSDISECFIADSVQQITEFNKTSSLPMVALGPTIKCGFSQKLMPPSRRSIKTNFSSLHLVKQIISSGMIIDLLYLSKVGLKDSSLFIDGVDHEWCWRAYGNGCVIGQSKTISMVHRIGDGRGEFLGIEYKIGSPIRLYYQTRNLFLLVRRNYVPLYWKFRNLVLLIPKVLINCGVVKNRRRRFSFIVKGIIDGIRARSGPFDNNWKK